MKFHVLMTLLIMNTLSVHSQISQSGNQKPGQPEELGSVNWIRDFDKGLAKAKKENKAVFLLFQEVPGCATCRNYGHNVLSHPLIAEAIETLFVPVAIFNNKKGKDAEVLKFYGEPSWNNPVVRIVESNKKDLVKRIGGNYSKLAVISAMQNALKKRGSKVPAYLQLLDKEFTAADSGIETATFSMHCFWTGEKNLGKLDGVVETQPGFMNNREVVKVKFNPTEIQFQTLLRKAKKSGCASHVFAENEEQLTSVQSIAGKSGSSKKGVFQIDKEPKYYLSKSIYRFVPMTQLQASRANSLIGNGNLPNEVLSPRQIELVGLIRTEGHHGLKSAINEDIQKAWEKFEKK